MRNHYSRSLAYDVPVVDSAAAFYRARPIINNQEAAERKHKQQ